jgi:hypothetical protein
MSTDITFKTAEPQSETPKPVAVNKEEIVGSDTEDNKPLTIAINETKSPFSARYFDITNLSESETFKDELNTIDQYLLKLVSTGKLKDDSKSALKKIKSIEKMANIEDTESNARKMMKLSAFVKYLQQIDYAI